MTQEEIAKLVKDVAELTKLVKRPDQKDVVTKDSLDKAVSDIISRIHPPEKKMVFGKEDIEDATTRTASFASFMKMVISGDPKLKTVMSEGTPAQGGYVVPPEFYADIIYNVPSGAVAYPECDDIPMGSNVMNIPRRLANLTIYWVDEDGEKTLTKPTFERPTLTLNKMSCIVPFTDELLEDNNVGLMGKVSQWVNDAIAAEKDYMVLVGNVGIGDPFMGVLYAVGVNTVVQAGASMDFDDIIDLITSVPEAYQANAKMYMNLATLGIVMKLKSDTGQPIWAMPTGTTPGTIYGKPYKLSGQIPSTLGAGTESAILYGDFKQGIWLGHRSTGGGLTVVTSNSAVSGVGANNVGANAYMQDETWVRFVLRHAQTVIRPTILGRLEEVTP